MATFMHITAEKNMAAIRRSGLKPERIHYQDVSTGVFCMPVTDDFFATHQWARELIRFGLRNPTGIYFKIPDDTEVWFGRYNQKHHRGTAANAVKAFSQLDDKMGFQVIIPRKITRDEIQRIRAVPKLGWRFYPDAKGRKPCLCPACLGRGEYGLQKLLEQKLYEHYTTFKRVQVTSEKATALQDMTMLIQDHHLHFPEWRELLNEDLITNDRLLETTGDFLLALKNIEAQNALLEIILKASPYVQGWFASTILWSRGEIAKKMLEPMCEVPEVMEAFQEYDSYMKN